MSCLTVPGNRSKVTAECYKRHNPAGSYRFFFFSYFLSCLLLSSCIYCPPDFFFIHICCFKPYSLFIHTLFVKQNLTCFSCPIFLWMVTVYLRLIKFMGERKPLLLTNNLKENRKNVSFLMPMMCIVSYLIYPPIVLYTL